MYPSELSAYVAETRRNDWYREVGRRAMIRQALDSRAEHRHAVRRRRSRLTIWPDPVRSNPTGLRPKHA